MTALYCEAEQSEDAGMLVGAAMAIRDLVPLVAEQLPCHQT
jgi:hypothetical protein